jgi:transmembrane sensor
VEVGAVEEVLQAMDVRLRRRRQRKRRIMGACTVVLVLGMVAVGVFRRPAATAEDLASAAPTAVVALPDRRELSDGSVVELRAGAEFEVAFTETERRVLLRQGEARFQVAKNPDRPFVVQAGGVLARAVGTAFLVQVSLAHVEVIVTEGRVQVSASPLDTLKLAPDLHAPLLVSGERAVVQQPSATTPTVVPVVSAVSAPLLSERLAWLAPRLEFSATPLVEALRLINQYSTVKLTLADTELGSVRLSGLIRADNVETFWRLLEEDYGFRVEHRSPTELVLHAGKR